MTKTRQSIPEELTTTDTISQEIEGHTFDFNVRFSVFGELLEVHCPIWDLPKEAQNMILGKTYSSIVEQSHSWAELLKFYFPMAGMGWLSNPLGKTIAHKIRAFRTKKQAFQIAYFLEDEIIFDGEDLKYKNIIIDLIDNN